MQQARTLWTHLGWPAICGLLLGATILAYWPGNRPAPATGFAEAVAKASPSVVNIYTSKVVQQRSAHPILDDPFFRHFFSDAPRREQVQRSLGSAVIVTKDGYLLTNYHVIKGADEILALLHDGRKALAQVVGSDADTDLAVLKIDLPELNAVELADPTRARVGDIVLAIGNPYNFRQTVTQGIISATGRNLGLSKFENFIQTDAAINPGNSGGALIDAHGRLLGINTAIYTQSGGSSGIGLAIPADLAIRTMDDLIKYGRPMRGWLGLEVIAVEQGRNGVVVSGVYPKGPAAQAGVLAGDIITAIDNQPVGDGLAGRSTIATLRPGDRAQLTIERDGESRQLAITVGRLPASSGN